MVPKILAKIHKIEILLHDIRNDKSKDAERKVLLAKLNELDNIIIKAR